MKENEKRIKELEAMVIHLAKRIEKLEGRSRITSYSTYWNELRIEAQ